MSETTTTTNNKKSKPKTTRTYEDILEEFKKYTRETRVKIKDLLTNLIDALKAEGKTEQEARDQLRRDLKQYADRTYIDRVVKEEYRTADQIKADNEKYEQLSKQEQLKYQEARLPKIVINASGGQEIVYDEDNDSSQNNTKKVAAAITEPPTNIHDARKQFQEENEGVTGAAATKMRQSGKNSVAVNTTEIDNEPDDTGEQEIKTAVVTINELQWIEKIRNISMLGKEIKIHINPKLEVVDIEAGEVVH